MKACGLSISYLPSRRTFDRRLKTISTDIKERIATTGNLFVIEGLIKPYIVATDTALLKSNGHVWHKSSMKEGIIPRSGIDTDARWGRSRTKGWIFEYKLHMMCSTDPPSRIIPLFADVTTANVSDKPVYPDVISCLSSETLKKIHYMVADHGFSGKKMYDLSVKRGFQLVCPVKRYKRTYSDPFNFSIRSMLLFVIFFEGYMHLVPLIAIRHFRYYYAKTLVRKS